jgi:hypothetical protein
LRIPPSGAGSGDRRIGRFNCHHNVCTPVLIQILVAKPLWHVQLTGCSRCVKLSCVIHPFLKPCWYSLVKSPAGSPLRSSWRSPRRSPLRSPGRSPLRSPGRRPLRSPGRSPLRSPGRRPLRSPGRNPLRSPGRSPLRSPARSLVRSHGGLGQSNSSMLCNIHKCGDY